MLEISDIPLSLSGQPLSFLVFSLSTRKPAEKRGKKKKTSRGDHGFPNAKTEVGLVHSEWDLDLLGPAEIFLLVLQMYLGIALIVLAVLGAQSSLGKLSVGYLVGR